MMNPVNAHEDGTCFNIVQFFMLFMHVPPPKARLPMIKFLTTGSIREKQFNGHLVWHHKS